MACEPTLHDPFPFLECCPVVPPSGVLNQYIASALFWVFGNITVTPSVVYGQCCRNICQAGMFERFRIIQSGPTVTPENSTYEVVTNPLSGNWELISGGGAVPNWQEFPTDVVSSSPTDATFNSFKEDGSLLVSTRVVVDQPYGNEAADFQALLDRVATRFLSPLPQSPNGFNVFGASYNAAGEVEETDQPGVPDRFALCNASAYNYREVFPAPDTTPSGNPDGFAPRNSSQRYWLDRSSAMALVARVWARSEHQITAPWYRGRWNKVGLFAPDGCTQERSTYCEGGRVSCDLQLVPGTFANPIILHPDGGPNEYAESATHNNCP